MFSQPLWGGEKRVQVHKWDSNSANAQQIDLELFYNCHLAVTRIAESGILFTMYVYDQVVPNKYLYLNYDQIRIPSEFGLNALTLGRGTLCSCRQKGKILKKKMKMKIPTIL